MGSLEEVSRLQERALKAEDEVGRLNQHLAKYDKICAALEKEIEQLKSSGAEVVEETATRHTIIEIALTEARAREQLMKKEIERLRSDLIAAGKMCAKHATAYTRAEAAEAKLDALKGRMGEFRDEACAEPCSRNCCSYHIRREIDALLTDAPQQGTGEEPLVGIQERAWNESETRKAAGLVPADAPESEADAFRDPDLSTTIAGMRGRAAEREEEEEE